MKRGQKFDELRKTLTAVALLLFAIAAAYYLIVLSPQKEKARLKQLEVEQLRLEAEQQRQEAIRLCQKEAGESAANLIKIKAGLSPGLLKEAAEQGLYLKDDYQSYYEQCLQRSGIKQP